jgi:hypothetical protein
MPGEASPNDQSWKGKISAELSRLDGKVVLVGHSLGGAFLLKYLSPRRKLGNELMDCSYSQLRHGMRINGYDDLKLPGDLAEKLAPIPRIFFYHSP